MEIMKIGIIGGGAIGLLFSFYLSESHNVTLYTKSYEQKELLNNKGLIMLKENRKIHKMIHTEVFGAGELGQEELLIIAVKQYHLANVLPLLMDYNGSLLFIQNGYGHVEMLETLSQEHVFLGVVEHGAMKHGPNMAEHTGVGVTKIAKYRSSLNPAYWLNDSLPDFPFQVETDFRQMLISKLIANAIINPLTAVLMVRNGELVENPYYHRILQRCFAEIAEVLEIEDKDAMLLSVEQICKSTKSNKSSMLKDVEQGRPTEIDAILGYIASTAEKKQKPRELIETLYQMVKGKETKGGATM